MKNIILEGRSLIKNLSWPSGGTFSDHSELQIVHTKALQQVKLYLMNIWPVV